MTEPVVAPYGGLMTKTLEDEKERELKLKDQAVEVNVDGNVETLRPEAIRFRGVDNLSTEDIKLFIDYYLNYIVHETSEQVEGQETPMIRTEYEALPINEHITFRIQWINDSCVNVVFKTFEDANKAYRAVVGGDIDFAPDTPVSDEAYVNVLTQEREAKPYNPIIAFKKQQDLSNRLGISEASEANVEDQGSMEEDDTAIVLHVRQSFQSDRKVKNASAYSRYYLMHGEPERKPFKKNRYRQREYHRPRRDAEDEEDLFADKLKGSNERNSRSRRNNDDEEDLFAYKLKERERSPDNRDRSPSRMEED